MFRVIMNSGNNGDSVCANHGMSCDSVPVLSDPAAACVAFHPGTAVTSDVNGWRPAVWCDGTDSGLACNFQQKCHHCPACAINLNCTFGSSDQLTELYVECVP